ncbi:Piso0_005404 [Millerozyma farinosa CBS 7064]|uniref:Piso0_005404 protein n=1 Tax=Pichia sorbitophila (strain ATCC MYA-4447 / BCRC 22081 / CBS 7064 / NBRC 10061 / NRRL Y-12695) TaxID=559304 RepID=G8Y233_PICSO|nr:Piso0_005404 [Millerozyma farinosa CBS 7064]
MVSEASEKSERKVPRTQATPVQPYFRAPASPSVHPFPCIFVVSCELPSHKARGLYCPPAICLCLTSHAPRWHVRAHRCTCYRRRPRPPPRARVLVKTDLRQVFVNEASTLPHATPEGSSESLPTGQHYAKRQDKPLNRSTTIPSKMSLYKTAARPRHRQNSVSIAITERQK